MTQATEPLGVIILCHTALPRAAEAAKFWLRARCPVVIHVDAAVPAKDISALKADLGEQPLLRFCARLRCEWGSWNIVAASQLAAQTLLDEFPDVTNVMLTSGSCLPLRPVHDLLAFLGAHPDTDFIESVALDHASWITGGLGHERFTLHFPFSWRNQRWLFDRCVDLQRAFKISREVPRPLQPHMGSQWWCLTRETLNAILTNPKRARYERYFKGVWIPDECYFQTLARMYTRKIRSRSLTLVKFDRNGRPNLFYDDHLQLLRRSDCFLARKIWPEAQGLYDFFLSDRLTQADPVEPDPIKVDRYFEQAERQRLVGRAGLYMQSRFPAIASGQAKTAAPYSVFCGFRQLFDYFDFWLSEAASTRAHGHLFAPERAEFNGGASVYHGAISNSAAIRDYNPRMFLTNLIWATRGERQCFSYSPRDNMTPELNHFMATDQNAQISVITGCFMLPLFRKEYQVDDLLGHLGWMQRREQDFIRTLTSKHATADVRIWTLAEFLENPNENLQLVLSRMKGPDTQLPHWMPPVKSLEGFDSFLADLCDQGLPAVLLKDFAH